MVTDVARGTTSDAVDAAVHVLLVDDSERWASFVTDALANRDLRMDVTVAGSANEAMLALREGSVDCVVADYRMPGADGLQLLERVRRERPHVPYILVTGEGSENVASRAIEAGATDYIVKDRVAEQVSLFTRRITAAVEQYRVRLALEESEERYRTVTEQSLDGIVIVTDDVITFCNRRFAELVGRSRSAVRGETFSAMVHPGDREPIGEVIATWEAGEAGEQPVDARLVSAEERIRHCEFVGRRISHESEAAALLSIRDVTERKRRERALERERALNRTVQDVLIGSRTREELERGIVEQLHDHGYALTWLAEPTDDGLVPRVVRGTRTDYVEEVSFEATEPGSDSEPTAWAERAGEPRFVQDFRELFESPWREAALEAGFRSGAALPLVHADISYGVLAVYHREPEYFDDSERGLLETLADTVAYAIHSTEADRALAADHVLEASIQVRGPEYYLLECLDRLDREGDPEVLVHGTVPHEDDQLIQYMSVEGVSGETLGAVLRAHEATVEVTVVEEADESVLQVILRGSTPEATLASLGAVVHSTSVTAERALFQVEVPGRQDLRRLVDSLEETCSTVSMLSCVAADRSEATGRLRSVDLSALTEKQVAALEAAIHQGYFEQPRRNSATDIADTLGVTHSTYLQHLRAAQRKVFTDLFGPGATM